MRMLVTGGSGFLGVNLVRHLLEPGTHEIASLDLQELDAPLKKRVSTIRGDIRDPVVVRQAMEGVEAVVHCAAALPLSPWRDIRSTDVDGTRILLMEAERRNVQRFIHISSTAVYGVPHGEPIAEDGILRGVGAYGRAKIAAERTCSEYRTRGMCIPILRPKSFIGPERLGVFALLYEWAADGRNFPLPGGGWNRYQLLDVRDLCEAIELCLFRNPRIVSDTFNIGARVFTTLRQDFQAVLEEAGFGRRVVSIPAAPSIAALKALGSLGLSPLYPWIYDTVTQDSIVSTEKAERILGFTPRHSNRDALVENFRWYRENRDSLRGRRGVSHRSVWAQGALGIGRFFF